MNALLVPERTSDLQPILLERLPRASLADRIAMRVGLWLIRWGARSPDTDREANHRYLERGARELGHLRLIELHRPY